MGSTLCVALKIGSDLFTCRHKKKLLLRWQDQPETLLVRQAKSDRLIQLSGLLLTWTHFVQVDDMISALNDAHCSLESKRYFQQSSDLFF